ncbi:MAG: hypothetical protein LC624_00780, partial [Halobacteriales archaeon]|nr:hypothetical protein [Halobacteriales archaeon]
PAAPGPPALPPLGSRCVGVLIATYNVLGVHGNAMRDVLARGIGQRGAESSGLLTLLLAGTAPDGASVLNGTAFALYDQLNESILPDLAYAPSLLGNGAGGGAGMLILQTGQGFAVLLGAVPEEVTTGAAWGQERFHDVQLALLGAKLVAWTNNPLGSTGDVSAFVPAWAGGLAGTDTPTEPLADAATAFGHGMAGAEQGLLMGATAAQASAAIMGEDAQGLAALTSLAAQGAQAEAGTSGSGAQERGMTMTGGTLGDALQLIALGQLGAQQFAAAAQGVPARFPGCA